MAQSAEVEAAALFSETLELMVGAGHPWRRGIGR